MSDETERKTNTFREIHDEMRKLRRRHFVRVDDEGNKIRGTVRHPVVDGRPKGKAAIKAAKRERVLAMKAAAAELKT